MRKVDEGHYEMELRARAQLPGYVLRGYLLRWVAYGYDDLPMDGNKMELPDIHPGSTQQYEIRFLARTIRRVVVDLLRPTGFSAITVEHLDEAARI